MKSHIDWMLVDVRLWLIAKTNRKLIKPWFNVDVKFIHFHPRQWEDWHIVQHIYMRLLFSIMSHWYVRNVVLMLPLFIRQRLRISEKTRTYLGFYIQINYTSMIKNRPILKLILKSYPRHTIILYLKIAWL